MNLAEFTNAIRIRVEKLNEAAKIAEKNYVNTVELMNRKFLLEEIVHGLENLDSCETSHSTTCDIQRNCDRFKTGNATKDINDAVKAYSEETGKLVYNCAPKYNHAEDFVEWLMSRKGTHKKVESEKK